MNSITSVKLLVPTKLVSPLLPPGCIRRDELLRRLGSIPKTRLTTIVAPAGFGKSTLVAQWLTEEPGNANAHMPQASGSVAAASFAWLTLDEYDQDGLRFLAYVAGAIERVYPDALAVTRSLLDTREPPPLYVLGQALLVDLGALPQTLTLVLDDYQAISSANVHHVVAYLLRNLPPTCRMIIISRSDPPLPLARLRAEQQLTELGTGQLRFNEHEASGLLANIIGYTPDEELVTALCQETEGWAIALQLAGLALQQSAATRQAPVAAKRQITDYLADEVFNQQPAFIRDALLALAVPERLCSGLVTVLLDPPVDASQAEELLVQLVRANLFLLPLDADGHWYRFHRLFRDMLLQRLTLRSGQALIDALHLRAAHWFQANGLIEDALHHLLAARANEAAAELIERFLCTNLGRELGPAPPGYWLKRLPFELIEQRVGLAFLKARLASFNTDVPALETWLAQVDQLLKAEDSGHYRLPWPTFRGDLETLRGSLRYWQGRPAEAIEHLHRALELRPVPALASQALHILGKAFVADGRYEEGVQFLLHGSGATLEVAGAMTAVSRYLARCGIHAAAGFVDRLADDARLLAEEVARLGLGDFWICYANAYRGRAAYEQSDLELASAAFSEVVRRKYQINAPIYIGCLSGLAQIALIQGDLQVATEYMQALRSFADEVGGAFLRHQALGCTLRLNLAQGNLAAALEQADAIGLDMHQGINTWFAVEAPRLSQARALICSKQPARLAQAETIISAYLAEVEPFHNAGPLVNALCHLALLQQVQGQVSAAQTSLKRALCLAAPRGLLRSLVDCGSALQPLLRDLAGQDVETTYLETVRAAFASTRHSLIETPVSLPLPDLPELLTHREMEILTLLAERWSNQEIAEYLVISVHTVRKHTSNIFGKLGASQRREAVGVARALGLLPRN